MIHVEHLTKQYGLKTAIADVSFSVDKGEVLAFLGPNGAGKTTTMRIITGSQPASAGTARVGGFDCFDQPMEVKRLIGYLPEIPPLYTEMTVIEYLTFVGRLKRIPTAQLSAGLDLVMQRLSLGDVRRRLIANLSRGYKQRVGLAQALIHNPPVLVLDEPTSGLDPKQIIEIRELIKELAGSHTILLSTHILPEATAVARRVVIIHEGRIVAEDSQERLSARLRRSEKLSVTIKMPPADAPRQLSALQGVLSVHQDGGAGAQDGRQATDSRFPDAAQRTFLIEAELGRDLREEVSRFVVGKQWGLLELKPVTITLEDVFLRLTQEDVSVNPPISPDRAIPPAQPDRATSPQISGDHA
jgi:gliding motility-associated transport system ATP-binding protein